MISNFVSWSSNYISMACVNLEHSFMNLRLYICGIIWREFREEQQVYIL